MIKPRLLLLSGPLGGVKNLQVTDPTTNSLRVRWEPAEGDVRTYNIFYVPTNGGAERVVCSLSRAAFGSSLPEKPNHRCFMASYRCRYQECPPAQCWETCSQTPSTQWHWCPFTPTWKENAPQPMGKQVNAPTYVTMGCWVVFNDSNRSWNDHFMGFCQSRWEGWRTCRSLIQLPAPSRCAGIQRKATSASTAFSTSPQPAVPRTWWESCWTTSGFLWHEDP